MLVTVSLVLALLVMGVLLASRAFGYDDPVARERRAYEQRQQQRLHGESEYQRERREYQERQDKRWLERTLGPDGKDQRSR